MAEQLTKKRIVFVADGALQYIPFAALATPETADTDNPIPLINQYKLVNLPSSSTLGIIRDQINGRQEAPYYWAAFTLQGSGINYYQNRRGAPTCALFTDVRPLYRRAFGKRKILLKLYLP